LKHQRSFAGLFQAVKNVQKRWMGIAPTLWAKLTLVPQISETYMHLLSRYESRWRSCGIPFSKLPILLTTCQYHNKDIIHSLVNFRITVFFPSERSTFGLLYRWRRWLATFMMIPRYSSADRYLATSPETLPFNLLAEASPDGIFPL
jgi:hypothetical protein